MTRGAPKLPPVVGELWREKRRPGHTVRVTKLATLRWGGGQRVTYDHVGVENIRAQGHPTASELGNFLKRYVRVAA